MKSICLINARLIQDRSVKKCNIFIKDGLIKDIAGAEKITSADEVVDLKNKYISAGFVDIHVHGGGGADFMDADEDAFHKIANTHLRYGTTAMLPTTLAGDMKELKKVLNTYNCCKDGFPDGAKFLGLHLEGPYVNKNQCGALDKKFIVNPNAQQYLEILNLCPHILRWTIAPELDGSLELGKLLKSRGIVASIGHSDADSETVKAATENGYSMVTHLYSAMSSVVRENGFRKAGVLESAYLFDELSSEIIADGCHLPKELLSLSYKHIGPLRLALVTDAMRAAGQDVGESILGSKKKGIKVCVEDGVAKLMDKTAFAGSVCTADRLIKTMVKLAGIPLEDAVYMLTQTPAKIVGKDDAVGYLEKGRSADLVVFDDEIKLHMVYKDGNCFEPYC